MSRRFLSSQGLCKFFSARLLSGYECGEQSATGLGDQITMGVGDFAQKAVGAQQTQFTSHRSGASACHLFVAGLTGIEQPLEVAGAQSGNGPLAPTERTEQSGVGGVERIESAVAVSIVSDGSAERCGRLSQRGAHKGASQRVKITLIGGAADFSPARQIGHASAQGPPGARGLALGHASGDSRPGIGRQALGRCGGPSARTGGQLERRSWWGLGAINGEGFGPIHRILDAQEVPEFVVGFLAVEPGPMFEADPFVTGQYIGPHVALEASVHTAGGNGHVVTQKAHDVRTLEGAHAVEDKRAVNSGQVLLVVEEQVGGVFALGDRPVVKEVGKGFEDFLLQGMSWRQQTVEQLQPVGLQLRIGQLLSTAGIAQLDKTVVGAVVAQTGGIHLLGQPESPVEANVHAKGIPGLQTHMTAAHHRMFIIVIKGEAFALFEHRRKPTAVAGAPHRHGQARFDGTQDGDKALAHAVAPGDVFDELFFAGLAGTLEVVRPLGGSSQILSLLTQTVRERLGVGGKVHQPDFGGAQIGADPLGREQWTKAGVEAQAIPAPQGVLDKGTELVDKTFGNEVFWQKWFLHKHSSTKWRPSSQLPAKPQPKPDRSRENHASGTMAVRFWLRLCRAALYRRIAFCGASAGASALVRSNRLPITNRRYGRLQICATRPRCALNTYPSRTPLVAFLQAPPRRVFRGANFSPDVFRQPIQITLAAFGQIQDQ